MAFASLIDTASGADAASSESLVTTASVGGGWCLVIVAFAVTSTLTLAVRQRERQIALLRSVGATGPQVRRMIVGEALAVALPAAAVAVPVGWLLGRVLVNLLHNTDQVQSSVDPGGWSRPSWVPSYVFSGRPASSPGTVRACPRP